MLVVGGQRVKRMRGLQLSFYNRKWMAATGIANSFNTFQIPAKYIVYTQFMVASALFLKKPYPLLRNEWLQQLL